MSQNVTVEGLKKAGHKDPEATFNLISDLSGAGVRASGFHSQDGGIAINDSTPNYDKIKTLLNQKEGAK